MYTSCTTKLKKTNKIWTQQADEDDQYFMPSYKNTYKYESAGLLHISDAHQRLYRQNHSLKVRTSRWDSICTADAPIDSFLIDNEEKIFNTDIDF